MVGCASIEKTANWTVEEFHAKARAHLDAGDWEQAIDYYHQLERRYPYGKYAEQSQLEVIYAYYRNREPELAISSADQFILLYPTHPRIDYAYYLKALSIFQSSTSLLDRLSRVDPSRRRKSFRSFIEVTNRWSLFDGRAGPHWSGRTRLLERQSIPSDAQSARA